MAYQKPTPGSFYVLDVLASTPADRIVSGPWPTAAAAEAERITLNIADDCVVGECYAEGGKLKMRPAPGLPMHITARE